MFLSFPLIQICHVKIKQNQKFTGKVFVVTPFILQCTKVSKCVDNGDGRKLQWSVACKGKDNGYGKYITMQYSMDDNRDVTYITVDCSLNRCQ